VPGAYYPLRLTFAARLVEQGATSTPPPRSATAAELQLDDERQRQARRYARQHHALLLAQLGLGALGILVLLMSGLSVGLRVALAGTATWQPIAHWAPAQVAAYFGVLYAAYFVLDLPLSYYGGFVLSHRYGLSTQTLGGWLQDLAKGLALSLVFELAAIELMYALLALTPDMWWLWLGGTILVFTVLLANLAPVLLIPIFYKLTPLPESELKSRLLALAARTHTRVRGVYSLNMSAKTTAANAMLAGLGNTRRIILGDTLLENFTPDEIEVVLAHELGHQVHADIPKLIAVQTGVTLGGLYLVNVALHQIVANVHAYRGLADVATMPLIAAALGVFGIVTMPLTNGFSRWVERQADAYALDTTHNTAAFIGAMTRLANQNLAEAEPAAWVEFLLHDHPSIGRRLAFARRHATAQQA
jgi:STE24 endopeptidase